MLFVEEADQISRSHPCKLSALPTLSLSLRLHWRSQWRPASPSFIRSPALCVKRHDRHGDLPACLEVPCGTMFSPPGYFPEVEAGSNPPIRAATGRPASKESTGWRFVATRIGILKSIVPHQSGVDRAVSRLPCREVIESARDVNCVYNRMM